MNIKIDKADSLFSDYIRLRDKKCVRCGAIPTARKKDGLMVVGLQASHFFGRRKESTRFDPLNVDALCMGCHSLWGSDLKEDYRDFKIRQLGQQGFDMLKLRSNSYHKKNRQLSLIIVKELMKTL